MSDLLAWFERIGPNWFSAVGTVGALLVAFVLLGLQLIDRRRESALRRRAQAELIAAALDWKSGLTVVNLFNTSGSPVYSIVVGAAHLQGAGLRSLEEVRARIQPNQPPPISTVAVLPPGKFRTTLGSALHSALGARPAAESLSRTQVDVIGSVARAADSKS